MCREGLLCKTRPSIVFHCSLNITNAPCASIIYPLWHIKLRTLYLMPAILVTTRLVSTKSCITRATVYQKESVPKSCSPTFSVEVIKDHVHRIIIFSFWVAPTLVRLLLFLFTALYMYSRPKFMILLPCKWLYMIITFVGNHLHITRVFCIGQQINQYLNTIIVRNTSILFRSIVSTYSRLRKF